MEDHIKAKFALDALQLRYIIPLLETQTLVISWENPAQSEVYTHVVTRFRRVSHRQVPGRDGVNLEFNEISEVYLPAEQTIRIKHNEILVKDDRSREYRIALHTRTDIVATLLT